MRRNIFDMLSKNFDVAQEIRTIWQLFTRKVKIKISDKWLNESKNLISILDCVDLYSFANWKSRNRCVSPFDMMSRLGIDENFVYNLSIFSNELLLVLEFVINMLALCEVTIKKLHFPINKEYQMLNENIMVFIEHFGYETHGIIDEEQIILIEKNPSAISAAEISEPEITKKIIQYNHYTLKGDIDLKKDIILALANELEPQRNVLEKINSTLSSDLFFMFNNMNLRHNNIEPSDKNYRPFVAKMDKNTLEYWYDETYQMILLAKLLLDNVARTSNIKVLKKNVMGVNFI